MKPGWKTTEFWLSLAAVSVGAVVTSGLLPVHSPWAQVAGVVVTVLGAYGYTTGRAKLKTADRYEVKDD